MPERVDWKSPVRANCTPESVRGAPGQPASLPRQNRSEYGLQPPQYSAEANLTPKSNLFT